MKMGDQIFGNSVQKIFETMQYGPVIDSIDKALEWLKSRDNRISVNTENQAGPTIILKNVNNSDDEILCNVHIPDNSLISNLLQIANDTNEWIQIKPLQRSELLFKLGDEILKQARLFCEIEVAIRGILSKDTKRSTLPLLTDFIQFYSSFAVNYAKEDPTWIPSGVCVGVFPDEAPLSLLGMFLGPSLAAGYNVFLQTGPKLSVAATLIKDIAIKLGFPVNTINIIPGNIDLNVILSDKNVAIISIFDDLYKDRYNLKNPLNTKILNIASNDAPMIIFDGADLDSACQCAIDAIWGDQGMTPWSTKTLLIQESIFNDFVKRIKEAITKIRIGFGNDANADIAYPNSTDSVDKLNRIVTKAKQYGAEIYPDIKFEQFTPTLLVGGNVFNNNVIKDNSIDIPIVNLRRFRTINEAALLANNTRQSLAVSVWTENIDLANEIVQKLNTTIVWINGHGSFCSNLPLSPLKSNGGYFGGIQGFCEYVQINRVMDEIPQCSDLKNGASIEKALNEASKAQVAWSKQTRFERGKKLQILAQIINRTTFSDDLSTDWIDDWLTKIYQIITEDTYETCIFAATQIVCHRKARGVIAIETPDNLKLHNKYLILAALIEGNSLVILNESKSGRNFYELLAKNLPNNLLQVVDLAKESIQIAGLYKELGVYFGEKFKVMSSNLLLRDGLKFATNRIERGIHDKVTVVKNIWTSVGQSFL